MPALRIGYLLAFVPMAVAVVWLAPQRHFAALAASAAIVTLARNSERRRKLLGERTGAAVGRAAADIGIAMGTSGRAVPSKSLRCVTGSQGKVAREVADIVLEDAASSLPSDAGRFKNSWQLWPQIQENQPKPEQA